VPKVISPCSAWTAKANKRVQFSYGLNYLIDIEYAIVVDVEATPARTYDEPEQAALFLEFLRWKEQHSAVNSNSVEPLQGAISP
jgi:hypothetical protein